MIEENSATPVLLVVFNDSIMISKKIMEKKKPKLDVLFILQNSHFNNITSEKNDEKKFKISAIKDSNANDNKNNKNKDVFVHYVFETNSKEDAEILVDKLGPRMPVRRKTFSQSFKEFTGSLFNKENKEKKDNKNK